MIETGRDVSNQAAFGSGSPRRDIIAKKMKEKLSGLIGFGIVAVLILLFERYDPDAAFKDQVPASESVFTKLIGDSRDQYQARDATNYRRDVIFAERANKICLFLKTTSVSNWVGKVYDVSSTRDGASFEIELPGRAYFKTEGWAILDLKSGTLAKPGTSLFQNVTQLKKGDWVRFSGNVLSSKDHCFSEASATQSGSISEPEFLFKFSDVTSIAH